MTDKKLTDKEIIKALECCCKNNNCEGCPLDYLTFSSQCASELTIKSLDLINRQKSEIDSAKAKIEICAEVIERQDKEIERLQSVNDEKFRQWDMLAEKTKQHYANLYEEAKDILKAEAYKEFAEKLKNKWFDEHYDSPDVDFDDFIDNLLKEMVGEENDR